MPALADHGVVALRESRDFGGDAGDIGGFDDCFRRRHSSTPKAMFSRSGLAEEIGILRHEADGTAQVRRAAIRESSGRR